MKKAFTLIELLIVIAILAILAIGVLAAIDPIEQFNRGRDSTSLNTAAEYKNAIDRYYAGKGVFPAAIAGAANSYLSGGAGLNSITDMMTAGELKTSFTSGGNVQILTNINVYNAGAAGSTPVVCVNVQSKTFRNNSSAIYDITGGGPPANCPNPTNSACKICYL